MEALLSAASLAGGTLASWGASRLPVGRDHVELLAGVLLVVGLVLIGAGLPLAR